MTKTNGSIALKDTIFFNESHYDNYDNIDVMDNLDPKNVLGSTGMLADQCEQIWELAKTVEFPDQYKSLENITICGMGGSRYGAYIVENLYRDTLKVPLLGYGDYHLPAYLNEKSLFILSSYSGGTEEPLNCAKEALEKNFPVVGLTGGGKALEMAQEHGFPALVFDQKYNPSGQPRLGTGYMVLGTIALLTKLGYIQVSDDEVKKAISELRESQEKVESMAKELAESLYGHIPVYFAAEFLNGNIHIIRNQTNETAKSFSAFSELPELNHHLMEGLKNPADKKLFTLFISSDFYSDKLKKRLELTKDVVGKNGVAFDEYKPAGTTKLSQMLNVLSFGGFVTLYLAYLYKQDPSLIPWVDYFKEQLAK